MNLCFPSFLENILLIAVKQKMAYKIVEEGFRYDSATDVIEWFYILHKGFQDSFLHCQNNVISYAKNIARKGKLL